MKYSVELDLFKPAESLSEELIGCLKPVSRYDTAYANFVKAAHLAPNCVIELMHGTVPIMRSRIINGRFTKSPVAFAGEDSDVVVRNVGDNRSEKEVEWDFFYEKRRRKIIVGFVKGDLSSWVKKAGSKERMFEKE